MQSIHPKESLYPFCLTLTLSAFTRMLKYSLSSNPQAFGIDKFNIPSSQYTEITSSSYPSQFRTYRFQGLYSRSTLFLRRRGGADITRYEDRTNIA